jgi:hypothetical protein
MSHGRDVPMAGVVSTFAGSGTSGMNDGSGLGAEFAAPYRLSMAPSGTLVVGDGNRVRLVSSAGKPSFSIDPCSRGMYE